MHPQALRRCLTALAAVLGLVACGSARATTDVTPDTSAAPVITVGTTTVAVPTTTDQSTTTAPPATTAAPTTAARTTTAAVLPQPAPAPDPNALEPARQLGTIFIPKIGLVHSMWEGVADSSLDRGPGHWPGTALPGQVGNVVVGGHRVSHDRPFRHIDQLVPGDQIVIAATGGPYTYVVTGSQVVTPHDVWIIDQTPARTLTLFACHPPGSTRERFVVFAKLVGS